MNHKVTWDDVSQLFSERTDLRGYRYGQRTLEIAGHNFLVRVCSSITGKWTWYVYHFNQLWIPNKQGDTNDANDAMKAGVMQLRRDWSVRRPQTRRTRVKGLWSTVNKIRESQAVLALMGKRYTVDKASITLEDA